MDSKKLGPSLVSSDGILFVASFVKIFHYFRYLNGRYTDTQIMRELRKTTFPFSAKMSRLETEKKKFR